MSCLSDNFDFSCFTLFLPTPFPKHFLLGKSGSYFFPNLQLLQHLQGALKWFCCSIPDANNSESPSSTLQGLTRRVCGVGKRKPVLYQHCTEQGISLFRLLPRIASQRSWKEKGRVREGEGAHGCLPGTFGVHDSSSSTVVRAAW